MVPVLSPPLPSEAFVHRFPTPLAAAWRNTELTRAPAERRAHVIAAADVAIRLLLAVLKADFDRLDEPPREGEQAFDRLGQASWGFWANAVTTLAKALRERGDAVTSPLIDTWLSASGGAGPAQLAFRDLIPLRNDVAHKGPPLSDDAVRKNEAVVRATAVAFLEALEPLAELMLFRIGPAAVRRDGSFEAPWSVYRGTDEVVVPRHVVWTGPIEERRLHVWLPRAGMALLIEPYMRVSPVASLNMDGLHLLCGLDRQGQLVLRHDRSGAEQVVSPPAPGNAHASAAVIVSGLSRESGVLPTLDGRLIGGRYELRQRLRRGSVCDVYEGRDTKLGRSVAVKVLRDDVDSKSDLAQRFERESEVLARLDHPNIIRVLDLVTGESGRPALVLELATGGSLRERVGRADPAAIGSWIRDVLAGLACAHDAGVIHRDVRPDNVLIGAEGVARLADFDLVAIPDSTGSASHTRTRFGLVGYLAPELLSGAPVSPASDIYALGVTWDELLHGELRSRSELGMGLAEPERSFILGMTAPVPAARPSAAKLLERLPSRPRGHGDTSEAIALPARVPVPTRARRWSPWMMAAAGIVALAVGGWMLWSQFLTPTAATRSSGAARAAVANVLGSHDSTQAAEASPAVDAMVAPKPAATAISEPPAPPSAPTLAPSQPATPSVPPSVPQPVEPSPPVATPAPIIAVVPPPPGVAVPDRAEPAAMGGADRARMVIPLPDALMVPEARPIPVAPPMGGGAVATIGRWRFDTLVMGVEGKGNAGVIGHFVMKTTDSDAGSKMYLNQTEMTSMPGEAPDERTKLGYLGNTSWPSVDSPIVSRCLVMKKDGEIRDERWFLFRFAGDLLRGWWVSVNQQTGKGASRWGVLDGAREGSGEEKGRLYPTPFWAKAADVCARDCLATSGETPCVGTTPRLDACVGECLD